LFIEYISQILFLILINPRYSFQEELNEVFWALKEILFNFCLIREKIWKTSDFGIISSIKELK